MSRLVDCQWCGREDIGVSKKGTLLPHVNNGGHQCIGAGMRVLSSQLTKPAMRRIFQRANHRRLNKN
jgi:hypothetical protein